MIDEIMNIKTGKNELRKFGITIGIIIFLIGGFLFYKEKDFSHVFMVAAIALIGFGMILPIILKPIYLVWMTFATILGWFMTRLILSFLFFVIMSPIGLVSRLLGKDFLGINNNTSLSSYWNYRDNDKEKNQIYEKQF